MSTAAKSFVFVHRTALCESQWIGQGTRIWAFAHVMDGATVGANGNVGDHAFIEGGARIGDRVTIKNGVMIWNGVVIEDDVFVGPGVVFTNDRYPRSQRLAEAKWRYERMENWLLPTMVRRGASIGAGAVILPGITIGRFASVAAGAVVARDVPDHRLVVGHPAEERGCVCLCGIPLSARLCCPACERRYELNGDAFVLAE